MQRVMIVGGPGSGKSTLAQRLGGTTGLPVHHVDRIHWLANWVERPKADKIRMAHKIEATEAWIFEGSLSATFPNRAARADTLIWLDLPIGLRFWRVTKRIFQNWGQSRPDMGDGCVERIGRHTVEFYIWIWSTRHSRGQQLTELIDANPHLRVLHLQSRSEIRAFEEEMK